MTVSTNIYPFPVSKRSAATNGFSGPLKEGITNSTEVRPVLEFPTAGLQMLIEHYASATRIGMTYPQLAELRSKRKLIAHKDGHTAELVCLPLGLLIQLKQMQLAQSGGLVTRYRVVVYNGTLLKPTRHALAEPSDAAVFQLVKEIFSSTYNTLTCLGLTDHLQPEQLAITEADTPKVFVRLLDE